MNGATLNLDVRAMQAWNKTSVSHETIERRIGRFPQGSTLHTELSLSLEKSTPVVLVLLVPYDTFPVTPRI